MSALPSLGCALWLVLTWLQGPWHVPGITCRGQLWWKKRDLLSSRSLLVHWEKLFQEAPCRFLLTHHWPAQLGELKPKTIIGKETIWLGQSWLATRPEGKREDISIMEPIRGPRFVTPCCLFSDTSVISSKPQSYCKQFKAKLLWTTLNKKLINWRTILRKKSAFYSIYQNKLQMIWGKYKKQAKQNKTPLHKF